MESKSISLMFFLAAFFLFRPDYNKFSFGFVCKERERQALLAFGADLKHLNTSYYDENNENFYHAENILSTWDGEECCNWTGVYCNRRTGNVVELHLQKLSLGGNLNPSLLELKYLSHLNLRFNNFEGSPLPSFLGSLHNLRYLNLRGTNFSGIIPPELGNLSNLHFLDISDHNHKLDVSDIQWLSHLSSLQHLHMTFVNLSMVSHKWLHVINMLPSLVELRLTSCDLDSSTLPTLPHINFTSLSILDLSDNRINSSLPAWLYNLTRLEELDLSNNNFYGTISKDIGYLTSIKSLDLSANLELEGEIPNTLGNLCHLQKLNFKANELHGHISGFLINSSGCITSSLKSLGLSFNKLSGPLPEQLGKLKNLEYLYLDDNSFSGSIPSSLGRLSLLRDLNLGGNELNGSLPETIWHLSNLETLLVSDNELQGVVTEANFANLRRLKHLEISSVDLKLSSTWRPPFQLEQLSFRNCQIGSRFPEWLKTQKSLTDIDLSNTRISGTVPTWFWDMSSRMVDLNLGHNRLTGELPKLLKSSSSINLSSNHFSGPLPRVPGVSILDLSSNSLSGPISSLQYHPEIGETNRLQLLDLSNNALFGEIPEYLFHSSSYLSFLKLENNKLTGKIPSSIGSSVGLQSLHLGNNSLSGELPESLQNCTSLQMIDLGDNTFSGSISTWLGADFSDLTVLRLRQNKFNGGIPEALCNLTSLQILDISHNNLSGSIPRCFSNISAIALKQKPRDYFRVYVRGEYDETASLVTNGRQYEYGNNLILVTTLDLSRNNLSGEIPQDLTTLHELRFLNLSGNHFTGKIPDKIGKMSTLESLDFSSNNLSGVIPQSITDLHFLNHLNLSYNNLSGEIPSGNQLQSSTELSYLGNPKLCGFPLKNCNGDVQVQPPRISGAKQDDGGDDAEDDWLEMKWFYISAGLGFVIGFWGFCGVLLWKQSWRHAYFGFITSMTQKLFKFCAW